MMFTNAFRIGGLHTLSWFQLLPGDETTNASSRKDELVHSSRKDDAATRSLLAAHIQLQADGHLTSWTYSSSDKGRKVKLWLFLPGRHDSLDAGLKVVKHGTWQCPGSPAEVTAALCEALRNRLERALGNLSYVRFGGMFMKCKRHIGNDSDFRKTLPSCEVTFTASEEAIFIHIRVRKRRMRPLAASDVRAVLARHSNVSSVSEKPAVVVAPYGLTGWLTGCCPEDLVRQLTKSKLETFGMRNSSATKNPAFLSRSWYVEVRMKFLLAKGTALQKSGALKALLKNDQIPEETQWIEKAFIFPPEAVLVPTVPPVPARTYLKRCWLRKLAGTDWLENALSLRGFSPLTSLQGHRLEAMGKSNTIWKLTTNTSKSSTSSGSAGSSIKSSDSRGSTGSESDVNDGEYREDADSEAAKADQLVASDVDSKRLTGSSSLKRGREPGRSSSAKLSRKNSPSALSTVNNTTYESNSLQMGPKGTGSHAGASWEWNQEVIMQNDADFFAEFGDFGDFFEGDGFGFGEPPGTAESSYMFPLDGDGSNTPGTQYLDTSDPMLLPIMDFPMLDGFGPPETEKEQDPGTVEDLKSDIQQSPSVTASASLSAVARSEAALIFAADYAPVDMPTSKDSVVGNAYRPEVLSTASTTKYVYGATPPPTPRMESYDRKADMRRYLDIEEERKRRDRDDASSKLYTPSADVATSAKGRKGDNQAVSSTIQRKLATPVATLATELECAMFQVQLHNVKGFAYCAPRSEPCKPLESHKECSSEITDASDSDNPLRKNDHPRKLSVPERIAGNADEVLHDGPRPVDPFVWRPVENSKQQQKASENFRQESLAFAEAGNTAENGDAAMQEMLDLIPLLVQQAASSNDISLDGEHGDGPLAWLTLHQNLNQQSPSFDSPSSVTDICDPSVTEVSPATVASILHSDMRQAIRAAFGDFSVAGPLSLGEWCRGKVSSGSHSDILPGDPKELSSYTGEPITPPQSACGSLGISKVISLQDLDSHTSDYRRGREADDSHRRVPIDVFNADEAQSPSYGMLPVPAVLVGYQDDWLKTSPGSIRYWEKAPFEPYSYPKPVTYYVLCAGLDSLLHAASDFFQQLSSTYEACKLGPHTPASVSIQTSSRRSIPGFVSVDFACKLKGASTSISALHDYVSAMESGWDLSEFRKSLRKACKSLSIAGATAVEGVDEHSSSTVIYVVSPTSEPLVVLQTMLEACQSLRPVLNKAKKILGSSTSEDAKQQPVVGFSIGRFALQIVTAETVLRLSSSHSSGLDVLKELSFSVYNKLRRIPQKGAASDNNLQKYGGAASKARLTQQSTSLSGLWKECSSNRSTGLSVLGLDAGNLRWDKSWHSPRLLEDSMANYSSSSAPTQSSRFLFEPLFILSDGCLLEHGMGQLLHTFRERTMESAVAKSLGLTEMALSSVDGACQRASFHCCYTWTANWQWLVAVWTDARGEMLDVNVIPVPSFVTEKDGSSKELFQLFTQVFQQGLQLMSSGVGKAHHIVLTRIGELYEAEYQEWQRVITMEESRNWAVQLRPETSGQQRGLAGASLPSSPATSSFGSRAMLAGYGIAKPSSQVMQFDIHGMQSVLSVSLATVSIDSSMQVLSMADVAGNTAGLPNGFGMAKTIATLNGAYLFVPSHGLRYLPSTTTELSPSKAELPAMAQLVQSKGRISPVASGYVLSGPCTGSRSELPQISTEEEWPSSLHVGLVAYFGNASRRLAGNGLTVCDPAVKLTSSSSSNNNNRERMLEARSVLEQLGADMFGLSWLTTSPMYLHRRRPLPFHCDVAQRLDTILCYMNAELSS